MRQTNPDDYLLFRRMSRFVSLPMCVLEQDEAAGGYAPLASVAVLIFGPSMEPYREHTLWHRMPMNLSCAGRNA